MKQLKTRIERAIFKTNRDGKPAYYVEVSVRNIPGKRPVRPKKRGYAPNLTQARDLRDRLEKKLHDEVFGSPTVSEYFEEYLQEIKLHKQPATAENERVAFEGHILPIFGNLHLSEVTPAQINDFLFEYLKDRAPSTKRNYRKFFRGFFKSAQQRRLIAINPVDSVSDRPTILSPV